MKIISLGIRKPPISHPYHRSRAGNSLFHKIITILTNHTQVLHSTRPGICNLVCIPQSSTQTNEKDQYMHLAHVNAQSVCNKILQTQEYILRSQIDICVITETWIKSSDEYTSKDLTPSGYLCCAVPHPNDRIRGCIALLYHSSLKVKQLTTMASANLECACYEVTGKNNTIDLAIVYHIPGTSMINCCSKLVDLLGETITQKADMIMIGDFNIHMDDPLDSDTILFNDFLDAFNLTNKVDFPTPKSGYQLDLILTSRTSATVQSILQGHQLADHNFLDAYLQVPLPKHPVEIKSYHKLKKIDGTALAEDIEANLRNDHTSLSEKCRPLQHHITDVTRQACSTQRERNQSVPQRTLVL